MQAGRDSRTGFCRQVEIQELEHVLRDNEIFENKFPENDRY